MRDMVTGSGISIMEKISQASHQLCEIMISGVYSEPADLNALAGIEAQNKGELNTELPGSSLVPAYLFTHFPSASCSFEYASVMTRDLQRAATIGHY